MWNSRDFLGGARCSGVKTNTKSKSNILNLTKALTFFTDHPFLNLRNYKKINCIMVRNLTQDLTN